MPTSIQEKVPVACPRCGHVQPEPRGAYSTICKKCHEHFRLDELLQPSPARQPPARARSPEIERRKIACFDCGTELEVPVTAESTMCKRCSHHVDLRDYHITSAVSKNFRTKGLFVVEEKGNVFNTEVLVGDAIIKGKFLGKLVAERSLTVYTGAQIRGSFKTGRLIVPAGNGFAWKDTLTIGGAEIAGELVANVKTSGTVWLRSTARFFGDVEAANLVIEEGAAMVGAAKIGIDPELAAQSATFPASDPVKAKVGILG